MAIDEGILRSKFGFNDPNVIAGILSDPGQVARYEREYQGIINPGASSSSAPTTDYSAILAQQKAEQDAQNAKYAGVMESQIPGIQQNTQAGLAQIGAKETNLKDRYSTIINQIKGKSEAETKTLQTNLGVEYGKRGIPLSSGAFQQDVGGKVADIGRYWNDQMQETNTAQSGDILSLQDLALKLRQSETEAVNAIKTAIATKNWEGAQNAVQTAQQLQTFNEGMRQFNASNTLATKEQELKYAKSPSSDSYTAINIGGKGYIYNKNTGELIKTLDGGGDGGNNPAGI